MMDNFTPATGLSNAHIQTLLPRFLRRSPLFNAYWQRLELPDSDFVDLAWSENPNKAGEKPLFILFHGLEGSFDSPYANGLLAAAKEQGWLGVMMHFRGCSDVPNRLVRAYHSGETEDARFFIEMLGARFPNQEKVATGISLGGNMLVNYLAKYQNDTLLNAATVISAPLDLSACSERIQQGFSRLYQGYLLGSLKNNSIKKLNASRKEIVGLNKEMIKAIPDLITFDNLITAPMHGYAHAQDYYQQCSGLQFLDRIDIPTRIIHSKDDPFMTNAVIPTHPLPNCVHYQLTEHGGHVGFINGSITKPNFWLESTVNHWFQKIL
ncbi:hydrolase [Aliivibrio sp. S10_S31]|uniref:hydrolase n=1 Tax=Aliivibrio sp. S10_S31 TaxID=2720224 RepID=UPI0016807D19|nr:hydrolase [Aliivibrio sp. S10_S31]MBD1571394.1 hydrolase [Aliivibrio sp. S10_S31]